MKNLIINSDSIVTAYDWMEKFKKHNPEVLYKERVVKTKYGRQLKKIYMTSVEMEGNDGRVQNSIRQSLSGMEYGPRGNVRVSEGYGTSFECKV